VGAPVPGKFPGKGAITMARKHYTSAFKEEACKLVTEQGYGVTEAGKQVGVSDPTLRYWLVQRGWEGPKAVGLEQQESEDPKYLKARVRELEQRLRRSEMEREILKKATAYFANQSP
jgi:transposase